MRRKIGSLIATTILATYPGSPLQAEIYRHIDADGNVVFTDKKPASMEAEVIELEILNTIPAPPKVNTPTSQTNPSQPNQAQSNQAQPNKIRPNESESSQSGYTLSLIHI